MHKKRLPSGVKRPQRRPEKDWLTIERSICRSCLTSCGRMRRPAFRMYASCISGDERTSAWAADQRTRIALPIDRVHRVCALRR